jgi:HK97 family phage prohead protease
MTEKKKKNEIRTVRCKLSVREITREDGSQEESRTITGTAIVFNKPSEILDDWGDKFREYIAPSCVTSEFLKTQDVKLNLLHNREDTLARSNCGEGNLKITVDKEGVHFEFEAPKCDIGDRALELVKAGVYSGCSFEFVPKDYTIKEVDDGNGGKMTEITHTSFESLSALTIAMDPAYSQTSVSARELDKKTDEYKAREAEAEKRLARKREVAAAEARMRERRFSNFNF